jgi:acyl-CoA hydrolase
LSPQAILIGVSTIQPELSTVATIWKSCTDLSGNAVFINVDNIAFIQPITGGSRITFTGPVSEGHSTAISVNVAPATILSGETVS